MAKDDKNWKKELEDLSHELLISKVSTAIKKDPQNWKNSMEEMGFTWVDDSQEDVEEQRNAVPENANQEYLLAYFEGQINFNNHLIEAYVKETESDNFNYLLFVKFYETGNDRLLHLLESGLSSQPTNENLLSGLSFFHENRPILSRIIAAYMDACKKEGDTGMLEALCFNFIVDTDADGYDALTELKSLFQSDAEKLAILDKITKKIQGSDEDIVF